MLEALTKTNTASDLKKFNNACAKILAQGHYVAQSEHVKAVVDISVPILHEGRAMAALTIPFIERIPITVTIEECLEHLREAASAISSALDAGTLMPL